MTNLAQIVVAGIQNGLAYGLVALALVMVFKTAKVLNFAQGTLSAFSGFLAYWFLAHGKLPWVLAAAAAVAATAALAVGMERLTVRPLIKADFFSIVIATLAVDRFLTNITEHLFGTVALPFQPPLRGTIDIGGVRITSWTIVILVVGGIALALVSYLVNRTRLGLAMRAFSDDQVAAQLMGISESTVSRATWVISITLGGVIGILLAPVFFLQVGYMQTAFIYGFTGAILGGFTSLTGGVLGGLLLGLIESISIRYAPTSLTSALPLLIVLVILVIRPRGLFTRGALTERV